MNDTGPDQPGEQGDGSKTPLIDIIDDIIADAREGSLFLGNVLDDLGDRSYGPLFFLLGLIIVTPIGAIPGVPIIIGAVLIILAFQFIFGLRHPWMPERFRHLSVREEKIVTTRRKIGPVLELIDKIVDERMSWAVSRPFRVFAAIAIIGLSITMVPLEFVPFGVAAPGAAIAAFGLAIVARDGLLMLVASGFVATTIFLLVQFAAMIARAFSGGAI